MTETHDVWASKIRHSLVRDYSDEETTHYGNNLCEVTYQLGHVNDSDIILAVLKANDGSVVSYAQVGCCMLFGSSMSHYLVKYFDSIGHNGSDIIPKITNDLVILATTSFLEDGKHAVMPIRVDSTTAWRSFRAKFGSEGMVGVLDMPAQSMMTRYQPSIN